MKRNGFSLIELLIVITIMVTVIALGALGYSTMTRKAGIESQVKQMYADLVTAQSQALYWKNCRFVTVSGTQFAVYSSSTCDKPLPTTGAITQKTLKYAVTSNSTDSICFDQRGVVNLANPTTTDITRTPKAWCTQPNDPDFLTSIVINATSIQIGRLSSGGACDRANISIQ